MDKKELKEKLIEIRNGGMITPLLEELTTETDKLIICKRCYGKGYSTEYQGGAYAMPDFIGDKKYKVKSEGIEIIYCTCERGKQLAAVMNKMMGVKNG